MDNFIENSALEMPAMASSIFAPIDVPLLRS
jgi:hypothetical protein